MTVEKFRYQRTMSEENRSRILRALHHRRLTPSEISAETEISRSDVYAHLKELQSRGSVRKQTLERRVEYTLAESKEEEYRRHVIESMIEFIRFTATAKGGQSVCPPEIRALNLRTLQDALKTRMNIALRLAPTLVNRDYVRWERTHPGLKADRAIIAQIDKLQAQEHGGIQEWIIQAIRSTVARPPGSTRKYPRQAAAEEDTFIALLEILNSTRPTSFCEAVKKLREIKQKESSNHQSICNHAGCSQTTVSKYLDMLEDMSLIDKSSGGYILREAGEKIKQQILKARGNKDPILARRQINEIKTAIRGDPTANVNMAEIGCKLAADPIDAKMLRQLMTLAYKDPTSYEELIRWYEEYMIAFTRDDMLERVSQIPHEKLNGVFSDDLIAALAAIEEAQFWTALYQLTHAFLHDLKSFPTRNLEGIRKN